MPCIQQSAKKFHCCKQLQQQNASHQFTAEGQLPDFYCHHSEKQEFPRPLQLEPVPLCPWIQAIQQEDYFKVCKKREKPEKGLNDGIFIGKMVYCMSYSA